MWINKILISVGNVVQLVEEDNFSDNLCKSLTCVTDNQGDISVFNSGYVLHQINKVSL